MGLNSCGFGLESMYYCKCFILILVYKKEDKVSKMKGNEDNKSIREEGSVLNTANEERERRWEIKGCVGMWLVASSSSSVKKSGGEYPNPQLHIRLFNVP